MKDTSIKVPDVLSKRFNNAKASPHAWEGYRNFSEFALVHIRKAVLEYEKQISERTEFFDKQQEMKILQRNDKEE